MSSAATTLTGIRRVPDLVIPSTQNTAPVLDFRCLYTYDLRRKAKRWQDGILRFHMFNKRVMVYDVPRNFIGDAHWREDEPVQDGDELQLDKGVLIQVGEATGSTCQDLTGLLEKRKKAPDVPVSESTSAEPATLNLARPLTVQKSQLRPKSLNQLLGTPRGSKGRATLPVKSPYEQRKENDVVERFHEPPAKRQRLDRRIARPTCEDMFTLQASASVEVTSGGPERNEPTRQRAEEVAAARPGARDIPSDREKKVGNPRHLPLQKSGNVYVRAGERSDPYRNDNIALPVVVKQKKHDHERRSQRQVTSTDQRNSRADKASDGIVAALANPEILHDAVTALELIDIVSDEEVSVSNVPSQSKKLQIISRKPRKKLMYRELLPQKTPAVHNTTVNDVSKVLNTSQGSRSQRTEEQPRNSPSDKLQEGQDRLEARLRGHQGKGTRSKSPRLFISQEQEDSVTLASDYHKLMRKAQGGARTGSSRRSLRDFSDSSLSAECKEPSIPRRHSTVHDTNNALSMMDEILISRSHAPQSQKASTPELLTMKTPSRDPSPPLIPLTPATKSSPRTVHPRRSSPEIQVSSSPGFQTQTRSPKLKVPVPQLEETKFTSPKQKIPIDVTDSVQARATPPQVPSQDVSPAHLSIRWSPDNPAYINRLGADEPQAETAANTQLLSEGLRRANSQITLAITTAPTHASPLTVASVKPPSLPKFQQPKPRSPLKKSVSDITSTRPTPPLSRQEAMPKAGVGGGEQEANPWSKEAWDLFGCGRDEVECTFEEFVGREGLG